MEAGGWPLIDNDYKSMACWSERRDLNSGPPVPQTGALTGLRYAPSMRPDYSERPTQAQGASPQQALARRRMTT